ncbi:MAG: hypothetical protein V4657_09420 [Pseudomonadota bacterium]
MDNIPSAQEIVMAVKQCPDYSPVAELAKASCMIGGWRDPYSQTMVGGMWLPAWQAKIAEAQFMVLLGVKP